MSWSIEEHIGEGRPWPEQVVVYRGETDESLIYARRSLSDVNKMVELMDTLAAENAKLRELAKKLVILAFARCADCDLLDASCALVPTQKCLLWNECESIARELGVEVDDG